MDNDRMRLLIDQVIREFGPDPKSADVAYWIDVLLEALCDDDRTLILSVLLQLVDGYE